eukprot:3941409-Prymnesium_polylepis.1
MDRIAIVSVHRCGATEERCRVRERCQPAVGLHQQQHVIGLLEGLHTQSLLDLLRAVTRSAATFADGASGKTCGCIDKAADDYSAHGVMVTFTQ